MLFGEDNKLTNGVSGGLGVRDEWICSRVVMEVGGEEERKGGNILGAAEFIQMV